jgi:hypothetical protein
VDLRLWRSVKRAAHYREQAKRLRAIAKTESDIRMHHKLLELATQYEELAASQNPEDAVSASLDQLFR